MASTMAISFTLLPTPLPHLTRKRSLNYPNPPLKTYPLLPGKLRQPNVFVTAAIASLGHGAAGNNNESPSEWRQRGGGRSPDENWRHRALHAKKDGKGLVLSRKELHRIVKLLGSIMSFVSVEGDPNKRVEEKKRDRVLQYIASNGGARVPVEEYYGDLARLLKDWHTDIQEQEQHSRELHFRRLSRILSLARKVLSQLVSWGRKFFACIGNFFSCIGNLFNCSSGLAAVVFHSMLLCVICIVLLPGFLIWLIWKCCVRKPEPPPSPPPINPTVLQNLLYTFHQQLHPQIRSQCNKKLVAVDQQLKTRDASDSTKDVYSSDHGSCTW